MEVKSWHDAGVRLEDSEPAGGRGGLAVAPTAGKRPKLTLNQQINRQIVNADDSEAVLCLVEKNAESLNCINIAGALHRIAARNKHKRARRDSLVRDRRFLLLEDALAASGTSAEAQSIDGAARSVADVLWSYATLGSLPPKLLTPVLTSVSVQLERESFEANHYATVVWALGKLQCKPVRLLERIEAQALERKAMEQMDMQNVANLLWGFASLRYQPTQLLPPLSAALANSGLCMSAKPVEVADLAFALSRLGQPGEHGPLLLALAGRASPSALSDFSSRQIVSILSAYVTLGAADSLPEGRVDAWVDAVRDAHAVTPLMGADVLQLEAALSTLGRDATWVKGSEVITTWTELAAQPPIHRAGRRRFTDDELRAVFESIDTSGDGEICVAELKAAIRKVDPNADDKTVERMLTFADADGDDTVSLDEFKEIIRSAGVKPYFASKAAEDAKIAEAA